jgi:hypothetical protein
VYVEHDPSTAIITPVIETYTALRHHNILVYHITYPHPMLINGAGTLVSDQNSMSTAVKHNNLSFKFIRWLSLTAVLILILTCHSSLTAVLILILTCHSSLTAVLTLILTCHSSLTAVLTLILTCHSSLTAVLTLILTCHSSLTAVLTLILTCHSSLTAVLILILTCHSTAGRTSSQLEYQLTLILHPVPYHVYGIYYS